MWPLTALGIEPKFSVPHSAKMDEVVIANGLVGSVVSDYFWYCINSTFSLEIFWIAVFFLLECSLSSQGIMCCLDNSTCRHFRHVSYHPIVNGG